MNNIGLGMMFHMEFYHKTDAVKYLELMEYYQMSTDSNGDEYYRYLYHNQRGDRHDDLVLTKTNRLTDPHFDDKWQIYSISRQQ